MTTKSKVLRVVMNYTKHTARIFTDSGSVYLTSFSKQEFDEVKYNTLNDWKQFLTYGEYSVVK